MGMIGDLFVKLGLKSDEFNKGLDDSKKKAEGFGSSIGNIFKQMASALGLDGLLSKFTSATQGIQAFFVSMKAAAAGGTIFSGAMKIVQAALVSTGIGAIVVALGALVSYFTMTERGAESLERGLAGLKAAFSVLVDRASAFGEGLVNIFSGKFSDGWDKIKGSVKGVGAEMNKEVSTAMQLASQLQDLEDKERNLTVSLEERRAKAAQLRVESREEGKTAAERKALINEAAALYKSVFKDEKAIESERARIMQAQIDLGETRDEDLLKLEQTKAKAIQKDTELAMTLKMLSREMGAINGALASELKLRNDVNDALSKPMKANQEIIGTIKKNITVENGLFKAPTEGLMDIKTGDLGLADIESKMTTGDAAMAAAMEEKKTQVKQFNDSLNGLIASGMASAAMTFGAGIGSLMSGDMNVGEFGMSLLASVGNFIVQFGEMMITQALAQAALLASISNPLMWPLALAAGVALVAAGTALSNISKKGLSGGASSGGGGGGGSAASGYTGKQNQSSASDALAGNVTFEIQGNKLIGVMNNVDRRNQNFK